MSYYESHGVLSIHRAVVGLSWDVAYVCVVVQSSLSTLNLSLVPCSSCSADGFVSSDLAVTGPIVL
jgi:hypothetical protein